MPPEKQSVVRASSIVLRRWLWSTPQRRWTTSFVIIGALLLCFLLPPIGIAVLGGAFAGSWLVALVGVVFAGLVGNRIGVEREKAARPPK